MTKVFTSIAICIKLLPVALCIDLSCMAKNIVFIYNDKGTADVEDYENALQLALDESYTIKTHG